MLYPNERYDLIDVVDTESIYVAENRNELVRMAQTLKADWLLQIDPDETFPETILRVMMRSADSKGRPVIVGVYANIGSVHPEGAVEIVDCLYQEVEDGTYLNVIPPSETEPFRVDAAGTGIFLTHLSVFEKIPYPWFVQPYITPTGGRKQFMNEDIAFCRTLREAGYEIWCDPLVGVVHWKALPVYPSMLRKTLERAETFRREIERERE